MTARSGNRQAWLLMAVVALLWLAAPRSASAQLGALVSPGRLHRTHASLEGVNNCLTCHSKGRQVAADKCLSCHKPVAERIARKRGVHGKVTTDCVSCHVEHAGPEAELRPFDQARFDHARDGGWPIDGLHAPLAAKCASCHKGRSFLTASPACVSCHADPHKDSLGGECTTCHSVKTKFASALTTFDHSRTTFPLAGAHGTTACASCHVNKQYKGIAFASCASCHKDPHRTRMGASCSSCHTETSWRTTKLDHARTAFPLRGKHAAVECAKCHVKPSALVKVRSDACAVCHTSDPHKGEFKQDCGACHNETTFTKGTFDHGATRFALTEKHGGLECAACHKTAQVATRDYRGLKTTCESCHSDVHRLELGAACESCHTTRTWDVKTFAHARPRAFFEGRHAPLTCAQCHLETLKPTRTGAAVPALRVGFTTTPTACVSCHADIHLGQLKTDCERCHSIETPKFAIPAFDHGKTQFSLTGKHAAPLKCEACHKVDTAAFPSGHGSTRRFIGVGITCVACHEDPHAGQLDRTCQPCHSVNTFTLPNYVHRNAKTLKAFFSGRHTSATCVACHKPSPSAPVGTKALASYATATTCTTCHTDIHRGALGPVCENCHKP